MAIQIKSSNEGLLHKNLGVKQGKKLTATQLEAAKHSKDPAVRRRATFAMNARKWAHHGKPASTTAHKLYGGKSNG